MVIRDMLSKYCPGTESILDVGTGIGTLPQACTGVPGLQERLLSIDLHEEPLRVARKRNPRVTFEQGDAYNLRFADNTFQYVTGLDFLNSEIGDIEGVGKEIRRVMKPEGTYVHFADTLPPVEFLVDEFTAQKKIVLPAIDAQNRIALVRVDMPLGTFLQRFDKFHLGQKMGQFMDRDLLYRAIDFIRAHISDPMYLFGLALHIGHTDPEGGGIARQMAHSIVGMLDRVKIKHTEPVAVTTLYQEKIVRDLKTAGFSDVKLEMIKREMTIPIAGNGHLMIPKGKENRFITLGGDKFNVVDHTVAPGFVKIESTIPVVVAVK